MKKVFSLIKANMSEGMNLFKINTKKSSAFSKIIIPIFLVLTIMGLMYSYAETTMQKLHPVNMEFVVLTLFIIITSILTIAEGIYKSSNLLFNCKDDNLLLSLPIKKTTVLFLRVFKFYMFELLYNSLFLLPAMVVYAKYMEPNSIYYIISFIGLLLFPIVPILISCFIGTFITYVASKFKGKNIVQTLISFIFLLGIIYVSFNSEKLLANIAQNASNVNDFFCKLYYPARVYVELVNKFNFMKLLEFILVHIGLFVLTIVLIGRVYFNINTRTKAVKIYNADKKYTIKTLTPMKSLIKKEFNRFINSPVFITNAGFGLVLFILGCIIVAIKFDNIAQNLIENIPDLNLEYIKNSMPVILFGYICIISFLTSITSSMISLEGKSFYVLKSLPLKPYKIIKSKILTAILIMLPCIFFGNIIIYIRFKFDLLSIVLTMIASFLFPLISETIGIILNLKYPRMDANNDTEVVKQSLSASLSVFIGMVMIGITILLLSISLYIKISNVFIMLMFTFIYGILYLILMLYLHKTCNKSFENIVV